MLKSLSYVNIALGLWYFMAYLLNSYSWPIAAIVLMVVHNGLVIRNLEQGSPFSTLHYVLGGFSIFFAGFLILWLVNIIRSALEQHYFEDVRLYIALTGTLALSLIVHFLILIRNRRGNPI